MTKKRGIDRFAQRRHVGRERDEVERNQSSCGRTRVACGEGYVIYNALPSYSVPATAEAKSAEERLHLPDSPSGVGSVGSRWRRRESAKILGRRIEGEG